MPAQAPTGKVGGRILGTPMNIQRCFDILDLRPGATLEEAKLAYKDNVNVWHPDRFSNNPRLRKKAELKVKEINAAYTDVKAFISARDKGKAGDGRASSGTSGRSNAGDDGSRDTVEVVAEAGTRLVLGVWSYLSKKLGLMNDDRGEGGKSRRSANGPEDG